MTDFEAKTVGLVHGLNNSYLVEWFELDHARLLTTDGDSVYSFQSDSANGFLNDLDLINKAQDVVADWDLEDWDDDIEDL